MSNLSCRLAVSERVFIVADRDFRKKQKADFRASRKVEQQFAVKLRKIANHIGEIVSSIADGTLSSALKIGELMARFSEALVPWAEAVTRRMHLEIDARDKKQWVKYAEQMGVALREEVTTTPVGDVMRQLMAEQVSLIKSIPLEAAQRVHELTLKGLSDGTRSKEIADEIMRTGLVTRSRAITIARTETARTSSILTQVRAQKVGSTEFIWRTARDANVRASHKKLEGKTFRWDDPPECDPGHRALPGQIWNCRCWGEPVIPLD